MNVVHVVNELPTDGTPAHYGKQGNNCSNYERELSLTLVVLPLTKVQHS